MLRRLAFIRAAGNVGLNLDEIRTELQRLPDGRTPTRADWQKITQHWRGRLDEQIRALEQLRDGLTPALVAAALLDRCAISNLRDVAASSADAPGAVYLLGCSAVDGRP